LYELIKVNIFLNKNKINTYKKLSDIKIDIKNAKEGKIIEFKTSNEELLNEINKELNVTQKYINLNINENDWFLKSNDPGSLNYLIKKLEILDYNIFNIDDNNISLRVTARENIIFIFENLLNEYIKNLTNVKTIEYKITEIRKLNSI